MSRAQFLLAGAAAEGATVELDPAESKHARVRRIVRGEEVVVFDGNGWSALAIVESIGKESVALRVVRARAPRRGESSLDLTLAVATLKSERFDWIVEKATELGVTRIRPFLSKHSLARPSAARQERWHQIALAAAKQCGRTIPPAVHPVVAIESAIRDIAGEKYLFAEKRAATDSLPQHPAGTPIGVFIGPEGGFSAEELEHATNAGCRLASLGPRILRAETAAITAVALCQFLAGDLNTTSVPP